jgi:hypothetical protein
MQPHKKHFWLALAILPFLLPLLLLALRFTASSLSSLSAGRSVFVFIGNFWWLIILVAAVVDWIAYLVHAQHSKAIPDDSRQTWTMLIFFFAPFANLFYYAKFIAPADTKNA